jgi:6-phosphogluconolactonase
VSGASFREIVSRDRSELARAVAGGVAALSRSPGGEPLAIALSGGSTPKALYETLAGPAFRERVDWSRLELFFSDERSVPPDDPESNYGLAARTLLTAVKPAALHRMAAESGDAEGYERLVRKRVVRRRGAVPVFDLVFLGMGDDGHTASLFPGTRALEERERFVVMNDVPQKKTQRMTFTYPLINAADRVWVLIAGADKHAMVAGCREARARGDRPVPVLGVSPAGELVWWLDEAASTGA